MTITATIGTLNYSLDLETLSLTGGDTSYGLYENFPFSPFSSLLETQNINTFFDQSNYLKNLEQNFVSQGVINILLGNGNNSLYLLNTFNNETANIICGNGNNTIYSIGSNSNITVGDGDNTIASGWGVDKIKTGNGNNLINGTASSGPINSSMTVTCGSGNDVVYAGSYTNFIDAGDGNNFMAAWNSGVTTFIFDTHFTSDIVDKFKHGTDHLSFNTSVFSSYQDFLNRSSVVNGDIVAFAHDGSELIIKGHTFADLTSDDFIFTGCSMPHNTTVINADGSDSTTYYDGCDNILQIRQNFLDGTHEFFEFNTLGQLHASYSNVYDASWNLTAEHIFDASGTLSETLAWSTDALGDTVTTRTTAAGLLEEQRFDYVDGTHSFFEYNTPGQAYPSYVNNYNSGWGLVSQIVYDASGHVV